MRACSCGGRIEGRLKSQGCVVLHHLEDYSVRPERLREWQRQYAHIYIVEKFFRRPSTKGQLASSTDISGRVARRSRWPIGEDAAARRLPQRLPASARPRSMPLEDQPLRPPPDGD